MKRQKRTTRRTGLIIAFTLLIMSVLGDNLLVANAEEMTTSVTGDLYEFATKKSEYEFSGSEITGSVTAGTSYGKFSIKGNMNSISNKNGVPAYEVLDSNIDMYYDLSSVYANASESEWHLINDKSNKINGISVDKDILSGSIIVQTSLTGTSWVTDVVYTDIRGDKSNFARNIYSSNDIQQVNGCYYRIIVAYELSKENEVKKGLGDWDGKETAYKKCAEVYEFYLINNSENNGGATAPSATPRKELGTKINTGKDNGYSGNIAITDKDPHYGWDLGTFFVNGYTRETVTQDGNPLFLKNVGDRVTLWFKLNEDITCLHGNSKLTIYSDANGYDQYFEIEKTNFKRGTLIIRYTDHEGKRHDPVIYTDYLAANARTGANTKVELFEEGDYEVALNYEILNSKGIDEYTNYRIFFKFSIRNGNCMVYPFDNVTGAELSDKAITENGFRLDMAKSRYLTIDVKKDVIKTVDGLYTTDERFNRPAKDGESYSDEGIYTFTVNNLYTESEATTKVIYVGSSPIYKALSLGYTLQEVNEYLLQGAELKEDGSIIVQEQKETQAPQEPENNNKDATPVATPITNNQEVDTDDKNVIEVPEAETSKGGVKDLIIVLIVIGAVAIVTVAYFILQKKKEKESVIEINTELEEENEQ